MPEPTPPPAAPPAAAPAPTPDPPAPFDPIMKSYADSMGVAVADLVVPKPIETGPPKKVEATALRSLGDSLTEPKPAAAPESLVPASTLPAATPAATPGAPAAEPIKVEKAVADVLRAQLDKLRAEVPAQSQTPAPAQAPADLDQEYVKTLNDDQLEELEFAKFADTHGHEGQSKKLLDYFKATNQFIKDNPDATPDSEEFKDFIDEHKPVYKGRRKLEHEMIAEKAAASVKNQFEEKLKNQDREILDLKLKAGIDRAVDAFGNLLVSKDTPRPQGVDPIDPDVAEVLKKEGPAAAMRKYPDEAPILDFTQRAAEAYLKIINGVTALDLQNETHRWLDQFVRTQENNMLALPEAERKLRGKPFATFAQLARLTDGDLGRYESFSHEDVLNMMATNAANQVAARLKTRQDAGWVRQKQAKAVGSPGVAAPPVGQAAATDSSPKGGASSVPGPAMGAVPIAPGQSLFMESLMPGSTKVAA